MRGCSESYEDRAVLARIVLSRDEFYVSQSAGLDD
jgi:hypothetical protein